MEVCCSPLVDNFYELCYNQSYNISFVLQDADGKVPLFWGVTADGCLAFANDVEILKESCGKSLAQFPRGNFLSMNSSFLLLVILSNESCCPEPQKVQVRRFDFFLPCYHSNVKITDVILSSICIFA